MDPDLSARQVGVPFDLQDMEMRFVLLAVVECVSFADDHFVKPDPATSFYLTFSRNGAAAAGT